MREAHMCSIAIMVTSCGWSMWMTPKTHPRIWPKSPNGIENQCFSSTVLAIGSCYVDLDQPLISYTLQPPFQDGFVGHPRGNSLGGPRHIPIWNRHVWPCYSIVFLPMLHWKVPSKIFVSNLPWKVGKQSYIFPQWPNFLWLYSNFTKLHTVDEWRFDQILIGFVAVAI